jgi:hypothetical protein
MSVVVGKDTLVITYRTLGNPKEDLKRIKTSLIDLISHRNEEVPLNDEVYHTLQFLKELEEE